MLKVFADFNARVTDDGACFILQYGGMPLEAQIKDLSLSKGSKVVLYQDEDDFEVVASLDYRYVDVLRRETWVAIPDWSTLLRPRTT